MSKAKRLVFECEAPQFGGDRSQNCYERWQDFYDRLQKFREASYPECHRWQKFCEAPQDFCGHSKQMAKALQSECERSYKSSEGWVPVGKLRLRRIVSRRGT